MIIEKINENQIRCRLSTEEMLARQLKISELAYGGDKAKQLLEEMMEQASREFGFNVTKGMPLMIEVAVVSGGITLTVTKVKDNEQAEETGIAEQETPSKGMMPKSMPKPIEDMLLSDEFLNKVASVRKNLMAEKKALKDAQKSRIYTFIEFEDVVACAKALKNLNIGYTVLYKNKKTKEYILATHRGDMDVKEYVRNNNMIDEFGFQIHADGPGLAFLEEHCDVVIYDHVIEHLSKM